MEKLIENPIINKIMEHLLQNYYIQLPTESLLFENRIRSNIIKFNKNKFGPMKISFNKEKLSIVIERKIDNENDRLILEEINNLIKLVKLFQMLGINEGATTQKRKRIVEELNNNNNTFQIKIECNDILYLSNKVNIMKVSNLKEYIELFQKYDLNNEYTYYRGQCNINWPIKPSIYRQNWIKYEKEFVEEMIIRNSSDFENCKLTIEKLTKIQHYGAPTRLLDLSKNPLVALYFACEIDKTNNLESHGEVVMFEEDKNNRYYYHSDIVSILSNISGMDMSFNSITDMDKLMYKVLEEKNIIKKSISDEDLNRCVVTHIKLDNRRIINQQGLFLLVGIMNNKLQYPDILKYLRTDNNNKIILILIPKNMKELILNQLSRININKAFIYPDIDKVADYLKNVKYSM